MVDPLFEFAARYAEGLTDGSIEPNDAMKLSCGMGKQSTLLEYGGQHIVLQIRRSVPFYEPVPEACAAWQTAGLKTLPLLSSGKLSNNNRFYVFPYVPWKTAEIAFSEFHQDLVYSFGIRLGVAFADLSTVTTSGYGTFLSGFHGERVHWQSFVQTTILGTLEVLKKRKIVSDFQAKRIKEILASQKASCPNIPPRLVYVDIKLENVLLSPDLDDFVIIDYDYLISGDPIWGAARFMILCQHPALASGFASGFFDRCNFLNDSVPFQYELAHILELLTTSTNAMSSKYKNRQELLIQKLSRML